MSAFDTFCKQFSTDEDCVEWLFSVRWPEGFECPKCGHRSFYRIRSRRLPLYECASCGKQTSLIAGTILEGSRTTLRSWFQAIYLHSSPSGISAVRLAEIIGTTYKTAWLIGHKIRHAISVADASDLLTGIVKINAGKYGNPHNPTVYKHPQEHPLLAGASIGPEDQLERVKIKQVPADGLLNSGVTPWGGHCFVEAHVDPDATQTTVVTQMFSRQRFWPLIQLCHDASSWINWTFHGIGPKHLQAYLDQYCFGINSRNQLASLELFEMCANTKTLTYPQLILRNNQSPQPTYANSAQTRLLAG